MYKYLYFLLISVLVVPSTSFGHQNRIGLPMESNSTIGGSPMTDRADSTYGDFTEISPADSLFYTVPEEDFWVVATAAADYDNDGDLDIAVLGYYVVYNVNAVNKLILMRNDSISGAGTWSATYFDIPLGLLTTGASDMAWGDVDGDGDLDLALGTDGYSVIYRNDAGVLALSNTTLPGYWEDNSQAYFNLQSISWVDFDNDGDLDLFMPSVFDSASHSYKTVLMRNDGSNGTGGTIFTESGAVFASTTHAQSSWADYDNDGDLDLLLVNVAPVYDDGFIHRYRNDGNGLFFQESILGSLSIEHGEARWGDYDGDGDLDILVAGNVKEINGIYTPMALRIYKNENDAFVPFEVIEDPSGEGWFDFTAATWADYDSDGDMDILLAGHYNSGVQIEGRARIYANNSNSFTDSGNDLPAPHAAGDRAGTFSWLDLDGEGDLDYFIAGEYFVPAGNGLVEAQMHIYRNDAQVLNLAPSTPSGITITQVYDYSVLLSWLPASDDHTASSALTYDLKLFHNNLPVSLPQRIPAPGNVSSSTEWVFTGLQLNEVYSWTLSTVDAAFTGSPLASGEFTMGSVSVKEANESGKNGYYLGQNFPNPAKSSTVIHYSIPQESNVSLKVYTIQGTEVGVLVEDAMQAGSHQVSMDLAHLPNGLYFYELKAGDFLQTRKMFVGKD